MKWNGKKTSSVVAAGLLTAAVADASPFVNLQILGSTNGGQSYSPTLTVSPGETIEYVVEGELNQSAVTNANHPYTLSNAGQSATADGITSLDFDLVDSGNGIFLNESLNSANGWTGAGTGNGLTSPGTVSGNKLEDIFPAQSAGTVVGGTSESVMLIGNFTVSSSPSTETLTGKWYTEGQSGIQTAGAIKVATTSSTHQSIIPSYTPGTVATGSESTADPYVAYGAGLTLTVTPPALTWGGANGGTWDVGNTASFTTNGSSTAVTYTDGNAVIFGDTDAGGAFVTNTNPIAITSNGVNPASVSFTNATNTYRFTTTGTVGIGGSTGVSITGGGTVIFSSPNTYTGGTQITSGALKAASGSLSSTGALTIGAAGSLYVGDASSSVPGTLTTGNQTWTGGGSYLPKVDGSGTADLLNIGGGTGTLTLTGTGAFNIVPQTGDVALGSTPENWEIAAFSASSLTGYTGSTPNATGVANGVPVSSQFALNTSALSESSSDFSLSLVEVSSGDDALYLNYAQAPEPGTAILVLGGAAPMFLARRRRRPGKTSRGTGKQAC
jgi:autotransporter-associated beta strand protein